MARASTKTFHYHACEDCRAKYPDGCDTPKVNGTCNTCRSGRRSVHAVGHEVHDCCRTDSRLVNKDDLKVYRLAGSTNWWICRVCARTFATNPRTAA